MGHNLNLVELLGVPEEIECPKCKLLTGTMFDDYDIDHENCNPNPGEWNLDCGCHGCGHEWAQNYKLIANDGDIAEVSDGYHTFSELYEHRHALFIGFMNLLHYQEGSAWKSKLHEDGTMYSDEWFIAGATLPTEKTITYHLPIKLWDDLQCEEMDRAPAWDGHTPVMVVKRLMQWIRSHSSEF
jgi:hypothetical protein